MNRELVRLSKTVSHALRHAPWQYELELDAEGWVTVDALLTALRERRPAWESLRAEHLAEMIAQSDKQRYEMRDGHIRALYGHSLPGRLAKTPAEPPETLFHGTSALALDAIQAEGLKPMGPVRAPLDGRGDRHPGGPAQARGVGDPAGQGR
jgi:putative RNA 2'-phosphotransferase